MWGLVVSLSFGLGIDISQGTDYRRGTIMCAAFNEHFCLHSNNVRITLLQVTE